MSAGFVSRGSAEKKEKREKMKKKMKINASEISEIILYNKMPMYDTLFPQHRQGKLERSLLYAFLRRKLRIANKENKKKMRQLKMYLLWPKVLLERARQREWE